MADLIGLCGFARSGKNSFADFIIDSCPKVRALSFAHALKKELQPFVFQQLGISTFTEDPKEKEMIRPLLVCWGTRIIREHIDKNYWVKKLTESVNNNRKNKIISIITDVRIKIYRTLKRKVQFDLHMEKPIKTSRRRGELSQKLPPTT